MSRRLSPQHAALYREWIANRRRLEALINDLHAVSRSVRQDMLDTADDAPADPPQSGSPCR